MKNKGNLFFRIALVVCGVVALYSAYQIFKISNEYQEGKKGYEALVENYGVTESEVLLLSNGSTEESSEQMHQTGSLLTGNVEEAQAILPVSLEKMQADYPDLVGWIQIPQTGLDYPVMQTPQEPNYYLHRDINGNKSSYGVPYLQENCDVDASDHLIIYGHHMKNGDMFGSLEEYQSPDYWRDNRSIFLWFGESEREYEIFAVFKTSASVANTNIFYYNSFVDAEDEEAYNAFVKQVKGLSFYETHIVPQYGEQLLTLSTCEYTLEDGRLVVMARRIK